MRPPNPFSTDATIQIEAQETGIVRASIVDIIGREVRVLDPVDLRSGVRTDVGISAAGLPEGVYFLMLESSSFNYTLPLVIAR